MNENEINTEISTLHEIWNYFVECEYKFPVGSDERNKLILFRETVGTAAELLKVYDPIPPTWERGKAYCRACGHALLRKDYSTGQNFCSYCGRAVKWE